MSPLGWSFAIVYGTWVVPLAALSLMAFVVLFFLSNPKYLLKGLISFKTWYYGLTKKKIQCDGLSISYIERGHLSTASTSILFVHGFSLDKEHWLDLLSNISRQIHVVAIDLPGHGDSEYKNHDLSMKSLTNIVKKFVDHIGMSKRKFHFVGHSMGGCIAGMYACQNPDDLLSVNFFAPYGVSHPMIEQILDTFMSRGTSILLPQTMKDMKVGLKTVSYKEIPLPDILKRGWLHSRLEKDGFYRKLLEKMANDVDYLTHSIHQIKTPTLLFWGKKDKILDADCVEVLEKKMQASHKKIVVLEEVGHQISLEVPKKASEVLTAFIRSL